MSDLQCSRTLTAGIHFYCGGHRNRGEHANDWRLWWIGDTSGSAVQAGLAHSTFVIIIIHERTLARALYVLFQVPFVFPLIGIDAFACRL